MNCVDKLDPGKIDGNDTRNAELKADKTTEYNDSQRLMVNQFLELHSLLIKDKFECPAGTEVLVTTMLAQSFSQHSVESVMKKTGLAHDELMTRIFCLENHGIVVCNDNEISFTDQGIEKLNDVSDKTLKVFLQFAEKIKSENYFSG